jgi:hypothetical protein
LLRKWYVVIAVSAGLVGLLGATAVASAATVSVGGAVATPQTYTTAELAALPQTSFSATEVGVFGRVQAQGVSLETLVDDSAPKLPSVKNGLLTAIIIVQGQGGYQRTFALGELDSSFGDHPAYVALKVGGFALPEPELLVPGDTLPLRAVPGVTKISVAIEDPAVVAPPVTGALVVEDGGTSVVLSPATLAALPKETLSVSFEGPGGTQTHTETGPTLDDVLQAAHIVPTYNTWVAGVGSDDYVATVTPAEAWVGGRPLLISLTEDGVTFLSQGEGPRLVTDGDIKGGRYDSGMDDLVVGDTLAGNPLLVP